MTLTASFKAAFDSLVRTYTPMLVGLIAGWLTLILGIPIPDEVREFVVVLVATVFAMLWYLIVRLVEVARGKASKLLTLGIVKTDPTYAVPASQVPSTETPDAQPRESDAPDRATLFVSHSEDAHRHPYDVDGR